MDAVKIVAFALLGAVLSLVLKEYKPFLGVMLSILTAATVFFFVLPELERITAFGSNLYRAAGGGELYLDSVMKIVGITSITWLGSDMLKDAGLSAASQAVVMAGKVLCVGLCLPIISTLFETVLSILPT